MILIWILVMIVFCLYWKWRLMSFKYWQKRGIPTLPEYNFIFGHFTKSLTMQRNLGESFADAHMALKQAGHKIGGLYILNIPVLLAVDTNLIKCIMQTEFQSFADRGMIIDTCKDPIQAHLFNLPGNEWRNLRRKLTPTFTSGKIKMMFPLLEKHCDILRNTISNLCEIGKVDIDMYSYYKKCGIDIIGHVAFGLDCNTLRGENEKFFRMATQIFNASAWDVFKLLLTDFDNPIDFVKLTSSNKEAISFFEEIVRDVVNYRRSTNLKSMDFLQLLIDVVDEDGNGLSMREITAQSFIFFIAGFETSATTVNFATYMLAKHPEIQVNLRNSFMQLLEENGGCWSYDIVMNHELLDCVIKETLRLFPPGLTLNRKCLRDFKVPDSDLMIPKDAHIVIGSLGLHLDPDNFPEPLEFKPERFSKENERNIKPFTYVPFGEGPRFCIGKRFGYLNAKLELMKIILNFDVTISPNMKPFRFSPVTRTLVLASEYPLLFNLKPLK